MSYLSVRDGFASYLYQGLTANSIPYNWFLMDPDIPSQVRLKLNCANISFMSDRESDHLQYTTVSIDIIHQKARTAIQWQDTITEKLLKKAAIIPNLDYSIDPNNPSALYGTISWSREDIDWIEIENNNYTHLNTTFELTHVIPVT